MTKPGTFAVAMNETYVDTVRTPGALTPEELARAQHFYENLLTQSDAVSSMGRIPRSYAEALLAVAEARNEVKQVGEDFHALVYEVFPAMPGLEAYLDSPAINRTKKDQLIDSLLEGKASPTLIDFLHVLNRKDRLSMLRFIGIAVRTLWEERGHRIRVLVESAVALSPEQIGSIRSSVQAALGKTPILVVKVKPELIGGLVIHAGDKVFDTSIRTKLVTLRNQLMARGTNEIQSRRDRFSHN